jgi:acetolactate synthase-1/2/3 large subunit
MNAHVHGGSIVGEILARRGVTHLFNLCGGHISPILLGAKMHGLTVIDVRDEATAAFAADAASRMTGIPGVCAVTAGPGVTNTVTAVKNAMEAQQPVIILGGATATVLRGRGSLQDIDQIALMAPITKWAARCNRVQDVQPMLERAFEVATEGVPGPVFLEIAVDLLYPRHVVAEWYAKESGVEKMTGPVGQAAQLALKGFLAHQFQTPHLPLPKGPRPDVPAQGRMMQQLQQVKLAMRSARQPVLVIGNQAMVNLTPADADRLAEAVRDLGMPTFLGGSARGLLGRHSDLQFRHARGAALKDADLVIIAGFPFDFRLQYGLRINRSATLVSINLDRTALTKNRRPTHPVHGHPGEFLQTLARSGAPRGDWTAWFETLRGREAKRDAEIASKARPTCERICPVHFFLQVEEAMDDDSVIIVDGGDFVATAAYIVRPRGPLRWLDPGVFGTLGVGGGFAVGAASARPGAELWLFYGDGSSAYSLAEFDTYVRSGYAPIAIIGNDASWQQIARDQKTILGDDIGTVLRYTDYHKVAEGYGGHGILLDDPAKIGEVLREAKEVAASGRPVCVNVILADSDFREGSISI